VKNPLAAHPPWRQLLIVSIVLPLLIALAVLAFAWPAARMRPRHVPVGIVGSAPGSERLLERLSAAQPGAFDFRLYANPSAARAAVADRDVYGAFVIGAHRISVLEASASSPAMAQLLDTVGRSLAANQSAPAAGAGETAALQVVDVVPLARSDPKGVVFAAALLPLTICSILVAAAVGVVVRFRPAWRQLVALSVLSSAAGLGTYLIAQGFLGALPHQPLASWAGLSLTILAISASTSGLIALVGPLGLGLAAVLMVFLGNPFSGVTSAPELLPDWVRLIGQWLPPGAGANLLRSTAYFGGDGAGAHLGVLLTWAVLGCAAIILGHHSPIRFAADPDGWRSCESHVAGVSPAPARRRPRRIRRERPAVPGSRSAPTA
jgi:hypothetical protein